MQGRRLAASAAHKAVQDVPAAIRARLVGQADAQHTTAAKEILRFNQRASSRVARTYVRFVRGRHGSGIVRSQAEGKHTRTTNRARAKASMQDHSGSEIESQGARQIYEEGEKPHSLS